MKIIILLISSFNLFAMNCSSVKDVQLYNGHYYTITTKKTTFDSAKQIAINNNGYLTIPNNQSENNFIKDLIGGGSSAWIGVYDPVRITNYCYNNFNCTYDDSRFMTIKNNSLIFKNWHLLEPNNLVKEYDIVNSKNMVSPIGEFWVAMNGNNGLWSDIGNHADQYNNPVKYKAVFEFDEEPDCYFTDDPNSELDLTNKICNTKIWDSTIDAINEGNTLECLTDINGKYYCPEALAPAAEFWGYDDGYSVKHTDTVLDKEKGRFIEHTGWVRDYVVGYSAPHTDTGISLSNGTYEEHNSYAWDYILKISSSSNITYDATFTPTYSNAEMCGEPCYNERQPADEFAGTPAVNTWVGEINKYCGWVSPYDSSSGYDCQGWHGPSFIFDRKKTTGSNYTCPNGGTLSGTKCYKTETIKNCPSGYTDYGWEYYCAKPVYYKYYSYGCPIGESVGNAGMASCVKSDPDQWRNNEATLDDSCNAKYPPTDNCTKVLNTTAYEYLCGAGYITIDNGLRDCPVGFDGSCNSENPPMRNCFKNISYKFYEYGCSDEFSTINYGLRSCPKTDPNINQNNESTLNDSCNAKYPPIGNCSKNVSYSFYEYLCNSNPNYFGSHYIIDKTGMTECEKNDVDFSANNSLNLDDNCNSPIPPVDNCKIKEFTCNSTVREPAWVDNKWQCSPFPCIGETNIKILDADVGDEDKDNDGWDEDGGCSGQMYLFNGKAEKCRDWDLLQKIGGAGLGGGGCCSEDKVFFDLINCKAGEKILTEKRSIGSCHEIGRFCSRKVKVLGKSACVQKSKSYCCFNSKLARILNEQGRPQLNISWGTDRSPQCRGFTPEEFQKIDMSQVDLSEFTEDIQGKMNTEVFNNLGGYVSDKVNTIVAPSI